MNKIHNRLKQKGVFAIEFALIIVVLGAMLVFALDLIRMQAIKGQLDRLSYSLVTLVAVNRVSDSIETKIITKAASTGTAKITESTIDYKSLESIDEKVIKNLTEQLRKIACDSFSKAQCEKLALNFDVLVEKKDKKEEGTEIFDYKQVSDFGSGVTEEQKNVNTSALQTMFNTMYAKVPVSHENKVDKEGNFSAAMSLYRVTLSYNASSMFSDFICMFNKLTLGTTETEDDQKEKKQIKNAEDKKTMCNKFKQIDSQSILVGR